VVVARPKAVMAVTESRLQSSASEKKNMSYPRLSTWVASRAMSRTLSAGS
jgi:hypothetical protein